VSKPKIVAIEAGTLFTPQRNWRRPTYHRRESIAEVGEAESVRIPAARRKSKPHSCCRAGIIDSHIHGLAVWT